MTRAREGRQSRRKLRAIAGLTGRSQAIRSTLSMNLPSLVSLLLLLLVLRVDCALLINVFEDGSDLSIVTSGSLNTTGLTFSTQNFANDHLQPSFGRFLVRNPSADVAGGGLTAPMPAFGTETGLTGFDLFVSSTGAMTGLGVYDSLLFVPVGYVSGQQLDGTAQVLGVSFADLGITAGTSFSTTVNNVAAETITLEFSPPMAIPEPSPVAILLVLGAAAVFQFRKRRESGDSPNVPRFGKP